MEEQGRVINNRYEILDVLGKGGMSIVYYAKDLTLTKKMWALKRVSYSQAKDEKSKRQLVAFEKEVELLTTLNHPDIPRIVDRIRIGDELYVCMDLINGVSLLEEFNQNGVFNEEKIIDLTLKLCDILIYLHEVRENPIIYRDIKLENVMLAGDRVKLIDFGIAKECEHGVNITDKLGTRSYAAPEQYLGLPLDERTDIYALGSMLYRLATGIVPQGNPHEFPSLRESNQKCSEGLEHIIHKCIQEKPEQRYRNCHELKKDLLNIDTLNSSYREKMQGRLLKFTAAISVCIVFIFITTFGYKGIVEKNRDNYLYYMSEALSYQEQNQFDMAQKTFIEATQYKPNSIEPYIYLLEMYQLKEGNREELIKESILTVERLVEDKTSKVYNNPEIMYRMAKLCFEIETDTNYALKAYNYFERVKESKVYEDAEIESYSTIAYYNKMMFNNEDDYLKLSESLHTLEAYTDEINDVNTRLDNYYTLTTIYNSYLNESVLNSKERIIEIGVKALELIADTPEEILEFQDEIILIERVATAYYTKGINETDQSLKRSQLEESLAYFLELEEMNVELSESIQLRIGNIYRGLYETYEFEERLTQQDLLLKACERYESLLKQNNQNLEAAIKLTDTYLDLELLKSNSNERDFTKAIQQYNQIASISDANKSASFRALKQRMRSYGL